MARGRKPTGAERPVNARLRTGGELQEILPGVGPLGELTHLALYQGRQR